MIIASFSKKIPSVQRFSQFWWVFFAYKKSPMCLKSKKGEKKNHQKQSSMTWFLNLTAAADYVSNQFTLKAQSTRSK